MSKNGKEVWVWWSPGESEEGLTGFHTKEERDRFSPKRPGPYKRRVSECGKTISQMDDWQDWMAANREILNRKIIP